MPSYFTGSTQPCIDDDQRLLLCKIAQNLYSANTGGAAATQRALQMSTVNANGAVAAGKIAIEFVFSPDFAGSIGGVPFSGATDTYWSAPALPKGEAYAALNYTITAGSARLTTIA